MKTCTRCRNALPRDAFHAAKKSSDGLQSTCKACNLARLNADNADKRAQGILTHSQRTRRRLRLEVLRAYGGDTPTCDCCNEGRLEFLAIDHVEGGGRTHLKDIGQSGLYTWLKRHGFPKGFRVLCHNCNQAIGLYGYCPHKEPRDYVVGIPRDRDITSLAAVQKILLGISVCRDRGLPLTRVNVAAAAGVTFNTIAKYRRNLFLLGKWPYHRDYPTGQPTNCKY